MKKRRLRQWSFLALPLFLVALLFSLFLGADQLCINDANRRLPIYPGAILLEESRNGIRPRGVGNTLLVFLSKDSQESIEVWYREHQIMLLNSRRNLGLNGLSHWYEPNDKGEGTFIYYLSQCVM